MRVIVSSFQLKETVYLKSMNLGALEKLQAVDDMVKRCLNTQGYDRPTTKDVAVELEGLRKITTHSWIQQTSQETKSLVLEVKQSHLYDSPLVSHGTNERESCSCSTNMEFIK